MIRADWLRTRRRSGLSVSIEDEEEEVESDCERDEDTIVWFVLNKEIVKAGEECGWRARWVCEWKQGGE